jgi:hypothetical protein
VKIIEVHGTIGAILRHFCKTHKKYDLKTFSSLADFETVEKNAKKLLTKKFKAKKICKIVVCPHPYY